MLKGRNIARKKYKLSLKDNDHLKYWMPYITIYNKVREAAIPYPTNLNLASPAYNLLKTNLHLQVEIV